MQLLLNPNYGLYRKDDKAFCDSLQVAETFGKEHYNVMRDIETLDCSDEFNTLNFEGINYKDSRGRRQRKYIMTKDGFTFLVMGYRGKKAAQFKEAYIKTLQRNGKVYNHSHGRERGLPRIYRGSKALQCSSETSSLHQRNKYALFVGALRLGAKLQKDAQHNEREHTRLYDNRAAASVPKASEGGHRFAYGRAGADAAQEDIATYNRKAVKPMEKITLANLEDTLAQIEWIGQTMCALDDSLRGGSDLCSNALFFPVQQLVALTETAQKLCSELKEQMKGET